MPSHKLMACAAGAARAAVVCAGNFASGWQWHGHGARAPLGPDLGLGEVRANEVAGCRAPTTCGVPRSIGPLRFRFVLTGLNRIHVKTP